MTAVIYWLCDCGCNVKVLHDTNGVTIVRCPNTSCKKTKNVNGKASNLWWKLADDQYWHEHDVTSLTVGNQ